MKIVDKEREIVQDSINKPEQIIASQSRVMVDCKKVKQIVLTIVEDGR